MGDFASAVGPFVLVQRPPDPLLQKIAMHTMGSRTVGMAHRSRMAEQLLEMTARFEHLQVISPRPSRAFQEMVVGRQPDSDVPIFEPSVSGRHALLIWRGEDERVFLRDLGSTNGTFVNATDIGRREVTLSDTDTLCFGDAQFLFLMAQTFQTHLITACQREMGVR
ncbi:MAG TPA: FHA domain-containing protein [Myxococcaceae bacterium]